MKQTETYVRVGNKDIEKALEEKVFLPYQGKNILFVYDSYNESAVFSFLQHVFLNAGKVALEGRGKYYIISDRYEEDINEPFLEWENICHIAENDIASLASVISLKTL